MLSVKKLKDYLQFAISAYDEEDFILPNGFEVISQESMTSSGLSGYAAFNFSSLELIIAFAGTSFGNLNTNNEIDFYRDLINNFSYMFSNHMTQFNCALELTKTALSSLEKLGIDAGSISITFVGHSLGAIVAEHMFLEFGLPLNSTTVVFDSPGSKRMMEGKFPIDKINAAKDRIINIIFEPNFINAFGKQIGKTFSHKAHQSELSVINVLTDFITNRKQILTHKVDAFKTMLNNLSLDLVELNDWNEHCYTGSIEDFFKNLKEIADFYFPSAINPFIELDHYFAQQTDILARRVYSLVSDFTNLELFGTGKNITIEESV